MRGSVIGWFTVECSRSSIKYMCSSCQYNSIPYLLEYKSHLSISRIPNMSLYKIVLYTIHFDVQSIRRTHDKVARIDAITVTCTPENTVLVGTVLLEIVDSTGTLAKNAAAKALSESMESVLYSGTGNGCVTVVPLDIL